MIIQKYFDLKNDPKPIEVPGHGHMMFMIFEKISKKNYNLFKKNEQMPKDENSEHSKKLKEKEELLLELQKELERQRKKEKGKRKNS